MSRRIGFSTMRYENAPCIISGAAIVGPTEGEGPLGKYFDIVLEDDLWGEKSWEKAESKMFEEAVKLTLEKANKKSEDIQLMLGGDLLNQIISANFAARTLRIPFLGLFGACSTMAESLLVGSALVDGGYANEAICATCSHFSTAERQFRFPLELGSQKSPTAQRTVTGAGASLLSRNGDGPRVKYGTVGTVIDLGIKDAGNMGAAMAPAAVHTITAHLRDLDRTPDEYDLIVTGDLGALGSDIVRDMIKEQGITLGSNYTDCGCEIFSKEQDTHCGGSGCGCSASVLNTFILKRMREGVLKKVMFVATGALLSPTSSQQGESIPGVAHALTIEM